MDDRLKETDRATLTRLAHSPPRRKAHSYSQQLKPTTDSHYKRHKNKPRHHSLDDNHFLGDGNTTRYIDGINSIDDDLFHGRSGVNSGAVSNEGDDWSQRTEGVRTGEDLTSNESQKPSQQPLPEFMGTGGGVGVFKAPHRSAVHPYRPPCLELRPHPLRETQGGKSIRTIVSSETQLWAGQESGVRVWKYSDAYELGAGNKQRRGDEDTAPFFETANISSVICMITDLGNKLVWSGHKDGKIRSWKMEQNFSYDTNFKEGFSWQAYRSPVLSMTLSFYGNLTLYGHKTPFNFFCVESSFHGLDPGDMWSGSEGGVIKFWPWESIEKSLALSPEERHMAALLVERSTIDLKAQVTVNGVCNISSSDVKYMLSDNVRAKVWAVGSLSFSLWNARSKELLKVFNTDGQIENRVDMPSSHDQLVEDEMNVKHVSKAKKEKPQGFLQRSRNAILGAADAVRRAAKGAGALVEDFKKTEAIVLAADGYIWTGCSNGLLIQWDGNGNRLLDFCHHPYSVMSFCAHGSRIWVGYASGMIQVLDHEGNLHASWVAHNEPVIKLVVGNGCIFSLATHGGIRGWNISSPDPIDEIIRRELSARGHLYTRKENIKLLLGTWNVGQGRASHNALSLWLGSAALDVDIVVVGLQEVEMGAGFLAMSAAKETVGLEGSSVGQWWQDHIGKALDEGSTFDRLGSRQLAALLIAIWQVPFVLRVRKNLRKHVGDLDVAAVACGLGRAIGNKGGVGLRLRVFDRIMCFANCHFAAHLEAVNRRNADFDHIFRTMTFSRSPNSFNNAAASGSPANQMPRGPNTPAVNPDEGKPDLAEADMVVFTGDFNYRLFGITYDEARDLVSQRSFDWLREKDQLRAEMKAGKVFQGMREALIRFPPTYKFEKGKPGLGGYDSGEKKRIPAWCDRVLYRDTRGTTSSPPKEVNLDCPVIASILLYEACMEVTESDHKPVRCKFNVEIAHVDKSVRRQEFGRVLESNETVRSSLEALRFVPETSINTNRISLQNHDTFNLKITNQSGVDVVYFQVVCEGQATIKEEEEAEADYRPRGSLGFPRWLEVTPAAGVIRPDQFVDIAVHHEESHKLEELVDGVQHSGSEDTRDKEVMLLVMVRGSCTSDAKTHRINVRHSLSGKPARDPGSKRQDQRSTLLR